MAVMLAARAPPIMDRIPNRAMSLRRSGTSPPIPPIMIAMSRGVDTSDNGLALEAFRSNAHGDHFLGNPHTLANFEGAFWRSEL